MSALVVAAAFGAVGAALGRGGTGPVRQAQRGPDQAGTAVAAVAGRPSPVSSATQTVGGVTTRVDITPVDGALAATEVIFLASGLSDPAVVVPDTIIQYSDGKVGLSWRSPCNRPAIALALTNTGAGAVVELTTGEFPVRSCLGMPDRWTAVVQTRLPLAEGPIRPVANGVIVRNFGDFRLNAGAEAAGPVDSQAGYGSALVDSANQPWVFGVGCSSRSARYQSPIGAIFEIRRTESGAAAGYSASDAIVCNRLAGRAVLAGPSGATFPAPEAPAGSPPRDCDGPSGSLIDVPGQRPYNDKFYDGDWSTWNGCLVRSDVIFSESLFESCGAADLRTITFAENLGERIGAATPTLRYIRDPLKVVVGTRPPLLTYIIAPSELVDSGLRYRGQSLWLSPGSTDAIYVKVGDDVERWPRLTEHVVCG